MLGAAKETKLMATVFDHQESYLICDFNKELIIPI